jgi:hypothetical protein
LGLESVASPSLSSLVSQWFITGVELMDYRIPEDPSSPVPVEGYVGSFVASIVAALSPRAAIIDPLGDPAYHDLRDSV